MGDMSDWHNEQMEFEDESVDYNPTGRRRMSLDKPETYHPFIWTRSNGEKIHIKEMNNHHLGNALRHLEKSQEGYPMPDVYFNMLQLAYDKGLGVTDTQIKALIGRATAKKPVTMAIYKPDSIFPAISNSADILIAMEDDGEDLAISVVDSDGEQKYVIASLRRAGHIIEAMAHTISPDEESPITWVGKYKEP